MKFYIMAYKWHNILFSLLCECITVLFINIKIVNYFIQNLKKRSSGGTWLTLFLCPRKCDNLHVHFCGFELNILQS